MTDLADFLLARIAEDEERARKAVCQCGGPACTPELGWMHMGEAVARLDSMHVAQHVVEWSPARVLTECSMKRRLVEMHRQAFQVQALLGGTDLGGYALSMRDVLEAVALPYADHPDYSEEWKP